MSGWAWVGAVVVGALPLAVFRRVSRRFHAHGLEGWVLGLVLSGAVLSLACQGLERWLEGATGMGIVARPGQALSALLVSILFVAPLEELAKCLVVLAPLRRGRLGGPREGVLFAAAVAAGFASAEGALAVWLSPQALTGVRAVAALPAHLFCAGAWGYALGSRALSRTRWFPAVFALATALHGLYDHIVFGRGAGIIGLSVPLAATMMVLAAGVLRDVVPRAGPLSGFAAALPDAPSLRAMRRALRRTDQPLMLRWIAIGSLVNVGVVLTFLAVAVWLGHRLGVDFAAADEAELASNGPLVLLGSAALLAFPVAGYLVARASGTSSVLEPAMGTALAIGLVAALLSATAPVALLFVSAVAPVAFGLACGGAWFGVSR